MLSAAKHLLVLGEKSGFLAALGMTASKSSRDAKNLWISGKG